MRKKQSTKYQAAVYQDDPDAIATVNVFDPDQNAVIPVEIGYYYHGKTGSTILLLNDARSKQLLSEASEIDLVRFSRSRPSKRGKKPSPKPAASYRPVSQPGR